MAIACTAVRGLCQTIVRLGDAIAAQAYTLSYMPTPKPGDPRRAGERVIRVFVSSTFCDMRLERERLVKHVFPWLRAICEKRSVVFTDVDLRWGITEEQAAEGLVLPICLDEIRRCRPFFVGILGERYGWIPTAVPREVVDREPWLAEHVRGRTSVTELEILHGVLRDPAMADHAFFYFRDPAYVGTLPQAEQLDMLERPTPDDIRAFGEAEARRRADQRRAKLVALKDRIRRSGLPVLDNYSDPAALAAVVRTQFEDLIDRLYPEASLPDPLDQEAAAHEAFAERKLLAYVERPEQTAALDAFALAKPTGQGLVLTGESGGGKTALLADWVRRRRRSHPDDFVFAHYFGATPESASVTGFLRRLLGELKRRHAIREEIPTAADQMRSALPRWLGQAAGEGTVVLVLDALNQIEGDEPDRCLAFMPRSFPPGLRVVASALHGPALDALRGLGWRELHLPLASPAERDRMIEAFLGHYAKTLRGDLRRQVVAARGAANPLFLRTVLEELRQFGEFERLPDRVAHYLAADSADELFRRVLRRWQEDFDAGQHLVSRALRYLWGARQGLAEAEWLELLGTAGSPLPRLTWSPLFFALEPHLVQRSGLHAFGHDFLRRAVEAEFVGLEQQRRAVHTVIADYFEERPVMTPRKAAEWPWQLHAARDWTRLEAALTRRDLFAALNDGRTIWELVSYWLPLRSRGVDLADRMLAAYHEWLKEKPSLESDPSLPREEADFAWAQSFFRGSFSLAEEVAAFLRANGCYAASEPLFRRVLELMERVFGPEDPDTLNGASNLALALQSKGDYAEAEPLFRRALEGRTRVLGPQHPDTLASVGELAQLLASRGELAESERLFRQALEGMERVLGPEARATLGTANSFALLLRSTGSHAEAERLFRRTLEARERDLGPEHPDTVASLHNLALLLESVGDDAAAEPLYRRALEAWERVLGPEHPDTLWSVCNLANVLMRKGDPAAEPLCRRALEARERVLGPEHPDTLASVDNLGCVLRRKQDDAQAEALFRRALEGRERVLGAEHPDTLTSVNNLAILLARRGSYQEAELLLRRAFEGNQRLLGPEHPMTQLILRNLTRVQRDRGR